MPALSRRFAFASTRNGRAAPDAGTPDDFPDRAFRVEAPETATLLVAACIDGNRQTMPASLREGEDINGRGGQALPRWTMPFTWANRPRETALGIPRWGTIPASASALMAGGATY